MQARRIWVGVSSAVLLLASESVADPAQVPPGASGAAAPSPAPPASETPGPASADEEGAALVGQARESFKIGVALAKQGQWTDALRALHHSRGLHAHPVTDYNIGYAERGLGHYTRALMAFTAALEAPAAGAPTLPWDLETQARAYLSDVQNRIARVAATVAPDVKAVSFDGAPLAIWNAAGSRVVAIAGTRADTIAGPPPAPSFDILVDPGRHIVVLSAEGRADAVLHVTFEAGSANTLVLGLPDEPMPPAPPPSTESPASASEPADREATSPDHTWAWVAYGVGGAGLGVGAVALGLGLSTKSELDDDPNCDGGKCPDEEPYIGKVESLQRAEFVATIGFGVGIVGLAVGTVLLLTGDGEPPNKVETRRSPRNVSPWIGLGAAGVSGSF